ncbi:hypothetical protein Pmani_013056 [Petrolisthes manimaculis]|uniref:Uncharacterized protein n=1 Tax=Petrolisthes manimaculis TaxID=1843537 RepID=A0AAE1PZ95_9EUCA|nr:hypothetical protein Pmani_013056 [Petrolisthes manimaculis]
MEPMSKVRLLMVSGTPKWFNKRRWTTCISISLSRVSCSAFLLSSAAVAAAAAAVAWWSSVSLVRCPKLVLVICLPTAMIPPSLLWLYVKSFGGLRIVVVVRCETLRRSGVENGFVFVMLASLDATHLGTVLSSGVGLGRQPSVVSEVHPDQALMGLC